MKRIITGFLSIFICFSIVGCTTTTVDSDASNNTNDVSEEIIEEVSKEPTFDVTIKMGDFDVTFYSQYTFTTLANQYSEYYGYEVIRIPALIKNNGKESGSLNYFYLTYFGSKGSEIDKLTFYYDDSLENAKELRPGAEGSCALYLLYDGDGDYYIEYSDWSDKVEVKLPIVKANASSDEMIIEENNEAVSSGDSSFNETTMFGTFELTFSEDYYFDSVSNQFSDHDGDSVICVPVHFKNVGDETGSINMFYLEYFGPKGTELDTIYTYFDNSLEFAGDLRPGAENDAYIYMLYDGDGDYIVSFNDWSSLVEVVLPITK